MKLRLTSFKVLLLFIMLCCIVSCNDGESEGTNPPSDEKIPGIRGVVTDTSGQVLENVNVFCLYYTWDITPDIKKNVVIAKVSGIDTFDFNLEQNFPNPFSNSTFLRYSFPKNAAVKLDVVDKFNNETVYEFRDHLSAGYYQHYLGNIVDSLQLKNGPYRYTFATLGDDGINYSASKELFIISDKGKPNSITDNRGQYAFNYKQTFAGDSVIIKTGEDYFYTSKLTATVNLRFAKDGYYSTTVRVVLYPNILLEHDIVLIKK